MIQHTLKQNNFQKYLLENLNISLSEAILLEKEIKNYYNQKRKLEELSFGKKARAKLTRAVRNIKDNSEDIIAYSISSLSILGVLAAGTLGILESNQRDQFRAITPYLYDSSQGAFEEYKSMSDSQKEKLILTTQWLDSKKTKGEEISFATLVVIKGLGIRAFNYPSLRLYMPSGEQEKNFENILNNERLTGDSFLQELENFNDKAIEQDSHHPSYHKFSKE